MKTFLTTVVVLTLSLKAFSQGTTLYNQNGTLKSDTTLIIGKGALERWTKYEDYVLWRIAHSFEYSDMAVDSKLEGFSIIKITVDQNGQAAYDKISLTGGGLEEEVIRLFEKHEIPTLLNSTDSLDFVYYLPIRFQFNDLKSLADSTGLLFLIGSDYKRIQHKKN